MESSSILVGHFDTTFPSAPSSSSFTRPKCAGQAHFRTCAGECGYPADPTHVTGCEPKEFDKITSVDGDTTPSTIGTTTAPLTSRKPHARRLDCSVFPQCLKPLFRTLLMVILHFREEAKEASLGKPMISVTESMSKKSRRNSTRSHSLRTHRGFYSDERDLREHIERRAQQDFLGENSVQRKCF